jgi:hypothetical protein
MATITRGAVTITASDVLGWSMTRAGRSVVHVVLGDPEPDVTIRAPGLRAGQVRCLFTTEAQAQACADTLAVPGGSWLFDAAVLTLRAQVTGDIVVDATDDAGTAWTTTATVQEVSA